MIAYLQSHLYTLAYEGPRENPWALNFLAAIWYEVQARYGGFLTSDAVFWISAFWAADFLLGSIIAIRDSLTHGPNKWRPSRVAKAVAKWVAWFAVCAICWGFKQSGLFGFAGIASLIEAAIMLHEASSVFRNAGILTGAKWVERFADSAQEGADRLSHRVEMSLDEYLPEPCLNGRPAVNAEIVTPLTPPESEKGPEENV